MSLRNMIPFLIAVFLVAVVGASIAIMAFGDRLTPETQIQPMTVVVVYTATTDPNVTPNVTVVTATPNRTQVALPPNILPSDVANTGSTILRPTLDPNDLNATAALVTGGDEGTTITSNLPAECIVHIVVEGDTLFGIAEQYEVNPFLMLEVNNISEDDAVLLQIGQEVLVPLEGCQFQLPPTPTPTFTATATLDPALATNTPTITSTPTATATPNVTPTPSLTPTITLPPTAQNAQVQIVGLENAADITAEGVRIRNVGDTAYFTGWTLSNSSGATYTFPEQLVFSETEVVIYTRAGTDTPIALYWGRDEAAWGNPGDIITLRDAQNNVQATARISDLLGQ